MKGPRIMKSRLFSAAILIILTAALIFFCNVPLVLNFFVAILSAAALYEVLIVTKYVESKALTSISMFFAFIIPFISEISHLVEPLGLHFELGNAWFVLIFVYAVILFSTLLFSYKTYNLEHLSVVFLMSVVIPCFLSTIVFAHRLTGDRWNIVLIILCSWAADSGGFIFGKLFGRHKLTPKISPKKTVEGAVGAVFATIGATVIFAYCVDVFISSITVNYVALVIYAFIGSFCAMFGDLVASLIKRSFGVKDFGKLIPGHGGIMDRFDSVLFVAPFLYIAMTMCPVFIDKF